MMWKAKPKFSMYGWNRGFAWWPMRIGDSRIWLEKYEYRQPPGDECMRRHPMKYDGLHLYHLEEFRTAKIPSAWRLTTLGGLFMKPIRTEWIEVKPDLRLVG